MPKIREHLSSDDESVETKKPRNLNRRAAKSEGEKSSKIVRKPRNNKSKSPSNSEEEKPTKSKKGKSKESDEGKRSKAAPALSKEGVDMKLYKQYDEHKRVLEVPDMYVGSTERTSRETYILKNLKSGFKMCLTDVEVPHAMERLFLEILSNAADNVNRSRRAKMDPGDISVKMTKHSVTITNGGLAFPVKTKEFNGKERYVIDVMMGELGSSSNYKGERHEAGRNGIGAKAVNIMSKLYEVKVYDPRRKKSYSQKWSNNMFNREEPEVEDYDGEESSTEITFNIDFERFGYDQEEGYSKETFQLFRRHCADLSFTSRVVVYFNDEKFSFSDPRKHAELYFGDAVKTSFLHYEWPAEDDEGNPVEITKKKNGIQTCDKSHISPSVIMVVLDTPNEGRCISFVNALMSMDGGVHVNVAIDATTKPMIERINQKLLAKLGTSPEVTDKAKRQNKITLGKVKPHVSILISCRLKDPRFGGGQSKTKLESPKPYIKIDPNDLKIVEKWQLLDMLYGDIEKKQLEALKDSDGKKTRFIQHDSGHDANKAGSKESKDCTLIIAEGSSAEEYFVKMVGMLQNGKDYNGYLAVRGKVLNVAKATPLRIAANKEIIKIKNWLGLREGMDYRDDDNFDTLRYGRLALGADEDDDGIHIKSLLLNYFAIFFPSLILRNFIVEYETPLYRVRKGKQVKVFYSEKTLKKWQDQENTKGWNIEYIKGLGTATDEDIERDIKKPMVSHFFAQKGYQEIFKLAFNSKFANQRKQWILEWESTSSPKMKNKLEQILHWLSENEKPKSVNWFIKNNLLIYSKANVLRSIPSVMDGFKPSQRKIIYAARIRWTKKKPTMADKVKVAQFGAYVAEKTEYAHGEQAIPPTIIGMTQRFVGANNITFLKDAGQVGSRERGPKYFAAPRYVFTYKEEILNYIFREEDDNILEYVYEEGIKVEPVFYVPVIPPFAVNGVCGIGTGWSTFIPNHNPKDIIDWLIAKIDDVPYTKRIIPWYRGFNGKISVYDRRSKKKIVRRKKKNSQEEEQVDGEIEDGDDVDVNDKSKKIMKDKNVKVKENKDVESEEESEGEAEESSEEVVSAGTSSDEEEKKIPMLSMVSEGKMHYEGDTVVITELPIGKWTENYKIFLEQLAINKQIKNLSDKSAGDSIRFEFDVMGKEMEFNKKGLKLTRSFGMSNMYLLDENGIPKKFPIIENALEYFYEKRLPYYELRRKYIIKTYEEEIKYLSDKMRFIQAILDDELIVMKRAKRDIYEDMDEMKIPREIYNRANISHLSQDDIDELEKLIEEKQELLEYYRGVKPGELWKKDLGELSDFYEKYLDEVNASQNRKRKTSMVKGSGKKGAARGAPKGKKK